MEIFIKLAISASARENLTPPTTLEKKSLPNLSVPKI